MENAPRYTLPQLARAINERPSRVRYAIDLYDIQPVERVGIIRLWTADAIPAIRAALRRTAERRRGSAANA